MVEGTIVFGLFFLEALSFDLIHVLKDAGEIFQSILFFTVKRDGLEHFLLAWGLLLQSVHPQYHGPVVEERI